MPVLCHLGQTSSTLPYHLITGTSFSCAYDNEIQTLLNVSKPYVDTIGLYVTQAL